MLFQAHVYFTRLMRDEVCETCYGESAQRGSCSMCFGSGKMRKHVTPTQFVFIGGHVSPRGFSVRFDQGYSYDGEQLPPIDKSMNAEFPTPKAALAYINSWAEIAP